jgi:hypothetical protein
MRNDIVVTSGGGGNINKGYHPPVKARSLS